MAVDSSTDCYFSLNDQVNKSLENNKTTTEMTKNNLNFYESMYHFKKMFPKFDSDVIETVLRANNGSVDRTIDQLLTMAADNEIFEVVNETRFTDTNCLNSNNNQLINYDTSGQDLPPSYESLISSHITSNSTNSFNNNNANTQVVSNTAVQVLAINKDQTKSEILKNETIVEDLISLNQSVVSSVSDPFKVANAAEPSIVNVKLIEMVKKPLDSVKKDDMKLKIVESIKPSAKSSLNRSNILIGELNRDFLRIKLTADQVKKIKTSIKKAKRNEITAMLNNKVPEKPELSFEIKKKFNMLSELNDEEESVLQNDEDNKKEKWMARYEEITKTCDKRRVQIMQDEYIAKLIQNEEFLNELRANDDFIQTLNYESNSIRINNEAKKSSDQNTSTLNEMSNAELKLKLGLMGRASRAKLSKIALAFVNKAKNKCNKAIDQTTITCTNLFTNFTTLKNIDYQPSANNSYYVSSTESNNKDDFDFIKSLQDTNKKDSKCSIKIRNDGTYRIEDNESYDLERIKDEELNSRFDTINKNSNKYKKVYRSFKTVINKRNSSASSSSSSSLGSSMSSNLNLSKNNNNGTNGININNSTESDMHRNQLPIINLMNSNVSQDLITFKNDYSYD